MTRVLARPAPAEVAWQHPAGSGLAGREGAAPADCRGQKIGIMVLSADAEASWAPVLYRVPAEVWRNVEEVAVFDDGSQAAAEEMAAAWCGAWPKLSVRKQARNLGYGGKQKAGLRYFLERGFDIVVVLEGGGPTPPEVLARLYHPIAAGEADAVFGSPLPRLCGGPFGGGRALYQYVLQRLLSAWASRALGLRLGEFHGGYHAYSLRALRHIDFSRMSDGSHFDTELRIKLQHQRYSILEVPIPSQRCGGVCRAQGVKHAVNVVRSVRHYRQTCRSVACHPEFQEYFVPHPLRKTRYSSHDYALRMTGSGRDVLDLGCGDGFVAAELARHGNRVTAVDRRPHIRPEPELERYLEADLDTEPLAGKLAGERFDRILLLDVLEHLQHPERVLQECRGLLRVGGAVIISLPNVANVVVRLALLFGHFDYQDRGILDRGHVRFFTRRTARGFLAENGYEIVQERTSVIPLDVALDLKPNGRVHRFWNGVLAGLTRLVPGLLGYQIVFLARPRPAPGS